MPPPERIPLSPERLAAALGDNWPATEVEEAIELLGREGKFPPGARRLPPELVAAIQRERLMVSMLRAVAELGYRQVSVQDVIERAGVSRPTFYQHFSNKEGCFVAALETTGVRLCSRLAEAAAEGGEHWRERVRLGLSELLSFTVGEPDAARSLIVESRGASSAALDRRDTLLERLARCVDEEASRYLDGRPQPPMAAAGIVGGIESLLYSRLNQNRVDEVQSLLPSLMYFVVQAYEGHEAASAALDSASG